MRGINRRKIFFKDADRDDFVQRLGNILSESQTACFAWSFMTNHLHLLLRTGSVPIATVMRRLLTGYAVSFNRRHRRCGHLFQNRYKSILCEQDVDHVLKLFGGRIAQARKQYRKFVENGVSTGRRPELTGGGLVRSAGGWAALRTMRKDQNRMKGDERILGGNDFVESVLTIAQEGLDRKYKLQARGYDLDWLVGRVAGLFGISAKVLLAGGKQRILVKARSVLCYWGMRELGLSTAEISAKLHIASSTASESVARGGRIVEAQGLHLVEEDTEKTEKTRMSPIKHIKKEKAASAVRSGLKSGFICLYRKPLFAFSGRIDNHPDSGRLRQWMVSGFGPIMVRWCWIISRNTISPPLP